MARNLVKYGVTELSPPVPPLLPASGKRLASAQEIQRTKETTEAKFLHEILFLSNVIARPFTTLSQVVITFNEDGGEREISVLKEFSPIVKFQDL